MIREDIFLEGEKIEEGYEKAKKEFDDSMIKINQPKFVKYFGQSSVKSDQKYVKKAEKFFQENASLEDIQAKKISLVLEAIIHEHAEMSEWLGGEVETVKTSDYDDYKNGIDTVAAFSGVEGLSEYLGLAIDVTFSADVRTKFDRIQKEIKQGKLAEVKYFKYIDIETGKEKFKLRNIPRVVVGANIKTVIELNRLWLQGSSEMETLGKHWIQFQILEEIISQLDAYEEYAKKVGQEKVAEKYRKTSEIIAEIYDKKLEVVEDTGERDSLHEEIMQRAKNFRNL